MTNTRALVRYNRQLENARLEVQAAQRKATVARDELNRAKRRLAQLERLGPSRERLT